LEPTRNLGADQQLQPGTVLEDRYQIENVVGVGGMSAVYQARDLRFSVVKHVAVKEMINQARETVIKQTIVSNFEREANILASLNHNAIPKIYDYFTLGDRSYLVMDFIKGDNLEQIITKTQGFFPLDQVIIWAVDLCNVLHHLHTHKPEPIVFRDMKPANVVITPDKNIVLVDFGIAKPFQTGQRGTMIGTEGYSPPEQYRGEATPLVDIYALGATLHHILTRKDPRIEAPFTFPERPISKFNPDVSLELETVINTALQYNPTDRFPSAAAMKEALIGAARKTGILTHASRTTSVISHDQEIKPLWTFECEDEIRGTATFHNGMIFTGAYDNNIYALNAATGEFIWKYAAEGGIVSKPAIYENNVYFGSEDSRVYVVSQRIGAIVWSYYTDGPVRSSPHISERHVFIGSDDNHLHVINASNGRQVLTVDVGAPIRSTPLVHNDVVFFGSEGGEFYCTDFRGQIKWRVRAKRAITSSPVVFDDAIYFGSMDTTIYAVDLKTGWVIWRFRMGRGSISTPCVVDNLLFTGSADENIYCINTRTSKEVWRFTTEHQVTGSPVIYKDSLYCGSVDCNLYCLDYKNGHLRWKFMTNGPITSTPIIHDDIVYFGSNDHIFYALPT
jgi:serine/threonine protein kinase